MRIHREGHSTLILSLIASATIIIPLWLFTDFGLLSILVSGILFISFLFVLRFFRYPSRICERNEGVIISPADGKIISINEETETEYFKDHRVRISIFMSGFNVHANWMPVSGIIQHSKYHPGRNLLAIHPKSSNLNERASIVIKDDNGNELLVRQIAGIFARRVVTYPEFGQKVLQGDELGFIKFGSRLDVFVPVGTRILVKIGDKVKGNISEIAAW